MAQGYGNRSEWERQQAAARREADRVAREQARLAKQQEKEARERHVAAQQRTADEKTAALKTQLTELDEVLVDVLGRTPFSVQFLEAAPRRPVFQPGALAVAQGPPVWEEYAPDEPGLLGRLAGVSRRYQRNLAAARTRWEKDTTEHEKAEKSRQQALASARAEHAERVKHAEAQAAAHNAEISARWNAFSAGEPDAVEWYINQILDASHYPPGFPSRRQVAYRPETRDVVVEIELPAQDLVSTVREYRYVKSRDEINSVPSPPAEIRRRYAQLVARVALRTLHEIFTATPAEVIEAVVFNGRVASIDRATGKDIRPHLLSVEAERDVFGELELARVDAAACLKHLNALVSPNPFDLEAVTPFIEFDLKRFRFTDGLDELADLDSRPNLLKLSPTEFEHLVKELFVAMGAEAWQTVPSKDGGVDAVATQKNLVFGGVCLIQAKRWTGLVGLDAVHALTGVMTDHNATTGVLVTTSWFSRTSRL